jgi:hypothetical protein
LPLLIAFRFESIFVDACTRASSREAACDPYCPPNVNGIGRCKLALEPLRTLLLVVHPRKTFRLKPIDDVNMICPKAGAP